MSKLGFIDKIKGRMAIDRISKTKLFEHVAAELANGEKKEQYPNM